MVTGSPPDPWRFRDGPIAERLSGYDLVGLTEMFVADARKMGEGLGYRTRLRGPGARRATELSSGLELHTNLARSPGRRVRRQHYSEPGIGWDRFAAKGFLLAWLVLPGRGRGRVPLAVVVTHLQSGHTPPEVRLRSRQLGQLQKAVSRLTASVPVLLLGDLNVDGNDPEDPGTDRLRALFHDFRDAALEAGRPEPTWCPARNTRARGGEHRYDFILFREGPGVRIRTRRASLVMTERVRGVSLSDHFGLAAELELSVP